MGRFPADDGAQAKNRVEPAGLRQTAGHERNLKGTGHPHHLDGTVAGPGLGQHVHRSGQQPGGDEFVVLADHDTESEPPRIKPSFKSLHAAAFMNDDLNTPARASRRNTAARGCAKSDGF